MINLRCLLVLLVILSWSSISYGQQEVLITRINCGGGDVTGEDGLFYEADGSNNDVSFTSNSTTLDFDYVLPLQEPYHTFRLMKRNTASEFDYTFNSLISGQYKVILHFAEPYHGVQNNNWNTRRFDIDINNGEYTVDGFNIMTAAALPSTDPLDGKRKVYKLTANNINITGNNLVINFTQVANDPIVNAIEVFRIDNSDTQNPNPPTLSSTGKTDTTVGLSWSGATDNVSVTGYKVFKNGSLEATLGDVSTYTATGLSEQTPYVFTVTALDAAGYESGNSNSVPITTDASGGGTGNFQEISGTGITNIFVDGQNVGIGTNPQSAYRLAVDGDVRARKVRVDADVWPDYVFERDYRLPSLNEVERHIQEKGHLINIPSATEVETNGIELGEMNKLLLEKIEELTLYILEQNKTIDNLQDRVSKLEPNPEKGTGAQNH